MMMVIMVRVITVIAMMVIVRGWVDRDNRDNRVKRRPFAIPWKF